MWQIIDQNTDDRTGVVTTYAMEVCSGVIVRTVTVIVRTVKVERETLAMVESSTFVPGVRIKGGKFVMIESFMPQP